VISQAFQRWLALDCSYLSCALNGRFASSVTHARGRCSAAWTCSTSRLFGANSLHTFDRDVVVDVTGQADGDLGFGNPFNKSLVPNRRRFCLLRLLPAGGNQLPGAVVYQVPAAGQLGEITVPYSDLRVDSAYWADRCLSCLLSHHTTGSRMWRSINTRRRFVQEIYDKHLDASFFISAQDMRLVPDA